MVTSWLTLLLMIAQRASRSFLQQNIRRASVWSRPYEPMPPQVLAITAVQIVYVFVGLVSQSKNVSLPHAPESFKPTPYSGKPDCFASHATRNISPNPPGKHQTTVPS